MARRQGRKGKMAAVAAEAANPTPKFEDKGLHDALMAPYDPLSEKSVNDLIEAACEILRDIGVGFDPVDDLTLGLLHDAGCDISDPANVKIPTAVVKDAIQSVAKSTRLWDRAGESYIQLDHHHTWFFPGMTCIQVFDENAPDGVRPSRREDMVDIVKLADALPNMDGVCVPVKIVENSTIHGEIDEFSVMLEHTSKPLEFLCEYEETLDVVIEMASIIRGGKDKLAEKPYFCQLVTPLPLFFAPTHTHQIINCARTGVPIAAGTQTTGGASSPITMAGCIAHALATDFTSLVLSQLANKEAFCMVGTDVAYMESATGGTGGFSQSYLSDMAHCQIMRSLGLPSATGIGGEGTSRRFDEDSVWEVGVNMTQTLYARPATVDFCGSMDEGLTFSTHSLVFCDDQVGLLRKIWEGITVNDEMLAMDLTRSEGSLGNYFANPHTAKHCRAEYWNSKFNGANLPLSSGGLPDEKLITRIEKYMAELMENHVPKVVDPDKLKAIRDIQQAFLKNRPAN